MSSSIDIRVSHRFSAAAERVFDAWLTPAQAARFLFRTRTGNVMQCVITPEVGGGFTVTDRRPTADGDESVFDVVHMGKYLTIDRPRRLVFDLTVLTYTEDTTRVTVMTWNLEKDVNSPDDVIDGILSVRRPLRPQVVALQELTPDVAAALEASAEIDDRYPYRILRPREGATGMGLVSSLPLVEGTSGAYPMFLTAGVLLPSDTAMIAVSPSASTRIIGTLPVCSSTFSTKTLTTTSATGISVDCDHAVSHSRTSRRDSRRLLRSAGSFESAQRILRRVSRVSALIADFSVE